ncbi:MAG: UPF0149 family protein [Bradyrhizobium sp.]
MPGSSRRRKQLEDEMFALGEEAMVVEEFDGFVAGLLVCPELISPGEWLPIVLNREGHDRPPALDDVDHANRVFGLIMDHYNDAALTLMEHPERYRPLFPIDMRNGDVLWEIWIGGFARAVDLRPAAWQKLLDADPDPAAAMLGMLKLADVAYGGHDMPREEVDRLTAAAPNLIPGWIVTLNSWRIGTTRPASVVEQMSRPLSATRGKVGRNEPCPCGSGKKYKRCCGLN